MNRKKLICAIVLALGAATLSGCLFVPALPTGEIEGYVVDAGAGSPVVGAKVVAHPEGDTPGYWVGTDYFGPIAITDAQGYYRLRVPEGYYTVVVTKEDFATSKVEGVKVASTAKLDIIQKPVFNPNWSLEPPEVTLTGVTEGETYTGPITFSVEARGDNHIKYIYAALGKTPGAGITTGLRKIFYTYKVEDAVINPADYGVSGWTTFEVVVYDQNENRTHLIRHIYIEPATGAPIDPPTNPWALAVTLSKKVAFYSESMLVPSG